jgi:dTDP-4-dehydrorhamnose reductase
VSSRLLVFGGSGQVGRALLEAASRESVDATGLSHAEADICNTAAVTELVRIHAPTCVVNAAAFTAVDKAERERGLAFRVNRDGARIVAEAAAAAGIPVIQLSTDYVFNGRKRVPYTEADQPAPLGVYGLSKEAGERAVREATPKHVILRTSWVYSPFGTNFVRTILRLGAERRELRIVDDQTGCPTYAADLATAMLTIVKKIENERSGPWGLYQYAGADPVTWYGFAQLIFEEANQFGVRGPQLRPISSAEFQAPAPRPTYSVLDTAKIGRAFGIKPRLLRPSILQCLKSLTDQPV